MANRSDEVFIYLRAIGAAKTRRDIEGVADSLEKLESGTEGHTEALEDNTEAQQANTKASKNKKAATDADAKSTDSAADATSRYNTSLIKTNDQLKFFNKSLKWKTKQTQDDITASERATKKALADSKKRYNQIVKDVQNEMKRKETVWRQSVKAREQYEKAIAAADAQAKKQRDKNANDAAKTLEAEYKRIWKIRNDSLKARMQFDRDELNLQKKHDKAILVQEQKTAVARKRFTKTLMPKFNVPSFARPGRVVLIATAIMGILDLIPVVGTALNSLLAGAIGAVNGLLPMFSIFGALPALILGGIQGMTVMTIVAKGIADALKGSGVLEYWKDLGNAIQEAGAKDIERTFGNLTQALMPTLMKQLVGTARVFNQNIKGAAGWFSSDVGVATVNALLVQGNGLLDTFLNVVGQIGIAFMNMGLAGGSVLGTMLGDLERLGTYLANVTGDNQQGISDYMDRAWESTKRASSVVGTFMASLYNIFRLSDPITKDLADGIEKSADNLLRWTKSKKGIQAIKDYFEEMRPNLKAVGDLAGAFIKAIFRISRSKNFKAIADTFTNSLIPALERLIESLDGEFILILTSMVDNLSQIANSGAAGVIMDIGGAVADLFSWITGLYMGMDETGKKIAIWAFVLTGFFGGFVTKFVTNIAKMIGALVKLRGAIAKTNAMKVAPVTSMSGLAAGQGKGGKGAAGGVVAGGGGKNTSNMASGKGATAIVPGGKGKTPKAAKAPKTPRVSAGGGAIAGGAGAALFFAGPITDSINGASAAMSDLDYKASVALGKITTNAAPVAPALDAMFSENYNRNVNTFGEALDRIANPTKWQSAVGGVQSVVGAITGSTTPLEQAKAQFAAIDGQLSNMPYEQATTGFGKIKAQAQAQKVPMDKLIELFPNLRDKMRNAAIQANGTAGQFDDAGFAADAMAGDVKALRDRLKNLPPETKAKVLSTLDKSGINAAYTELARVDGKTATTYIKTVYQRQVEDINNSTPGGMDLDVFFAGGVAQAGKMALGGELGPEFTMTRGGDLGIIGLNGPEFFKPSMNTAIIPASATSNPMSGNYGEAPDWARMALQGAVSNRVASAAPAMSKGDRGASKSEYNFDFSNAVFGNGTDTNAIKDAIMKAMSEAERDKRERS